MDHFFLLVAAYPASVPMVTPMALAAFAPASPPLNYPAVWPAVLPAVLPASVNYATVGLFVVTVGVPPAFVGFCCVEFA